MNERIEIVERLTLHEQFRLIEIAHETADPEVRKYALSVLQQHLNPQVMAWREMTVCDEI